MIVSLRYGPVKAMALGGLKMVPSSSVFWSHTQKKAFQRAGNIRLSALCGNCSLDFNCRAKFAVDISFSEHYDRLWVNCVTVFAFLEQ